MAISDSCPHFFKVFLPNLSSEFLKIPPAFRKHLTSDSLGLVSLKGPSGNMWTVRLIKCANEFRFKNGWKEFVADHSLETGDFLVFRLEESSCFSVMVFDATACQKEAAFASSPFRRDVSDVTSDETKEMNIKVEDDDSQILALPSNEELHTKEKKKRKISSPTAQEPTVIEMYTPLNDILASKRSKKCHKNGKHKNENLSSRTSFGATSGEMIWENGKRELEKGSITSSSKKLVGLTSSEKLNKSSEGLSFMKSGEVRRRGNFVTRIQKVPTLVSQRRLVTTEEVDKAFQAASSFTSEKPFFFNVMRDSYVYQGFYMNVPYSFTTTNISKISRNITLWDPTNKPWPVSYLTYGTRASFSAGWGAFSWGNNLEKFDVCVFELFKRDNFRVHIYRVVPEIKPLIRRSLLEL